MTDPHYQCNKQRKFAWAKYYSEVNSQIEHVYIIKCVIGNIDRENLPNHISREFVEMADQLTKKYTCPVCLDLVTVDNVKITMCGHIYCDTCLDVIKSTFKKCAICRKALV